MSSGPSVIVKKGGFLAALAQGFFGTLMVAIICGTVLAFFGLRMVDRYAGSVSDHMAKAVPELLAAVADWRATLPAMIVDPFNDRRAPEYRASVEITARLVATNDRRDPCVVLDVRNDGAETVSLLAVRVVVLDDRQVPVGERNVHVATPLSWPDADLRGPLLPGAQRPLAVRVPGAAAAASVTVEVTDVRVWNGPLPDEETIDFDASDDDAPAPPAGTGLPTRTPHLVAGCSLVRSQGRGRPAT